MWLESSEPSYILYTSGTTGKPKGVQRDVGGYAVALAASMEYIFEGRAGDTLFTAFSMSKGITATITHRLVERGVLAYDEPLATWWPAFAAHGKGGITVRHALTHQAGLPTFKGLPPSEEPSLEATGRHLEQATPEWAPGASMGYHGMTFGTLLGRTIELATGKPFAQVMQEEITGPAHARDLWFGIPDDPAIHARVATLCPARAPDPSSGVHPMTDDERANLAQTTAWGNRRDIRAGCIPASGMIGSEIGRAHV